MPVKLNSSGGGSVTLNPPTTATDYTLTVPGQAGTIAAFDSNNNITAANNMLLNAGYGSSAIVYGCRAWVNFDGTTTPPTIRASGNISSVTRPSTGIYIVTFTNSMPDGNYVMNGNAIQVGAGNGPIISISNGTTPNSASISVTCTNDAGAVQNASIINLTFFR